MVVWVFGSRKKRSEGRWLLVGALMATTALVMAPKAEAGGEIVDPTPRLEDGWFYKRIPAISADGSIFIANFQDMMGTAYRTHYYAGGDPVLLPNLGWGTTTATGMSGDGRFVVGRSANADRNQRAFIWDAQTGEMRDLGLLYPGIENAWMEAWDVSGDGQRAVGFYSRVGMARGFAWVDDETGVGNLHLLQSLDDANNWTAYALSDDGRYATGYSDGNATHSRAVRWDLSGLEAGGGGSDTILDLGTFTGFEGGGSFGADISADGKVVVGWSSDQDGIDRAFRWVEGASGGRAENAQMYDLGTLFEESDSTSSANAVSRNGAYVVGTSSAGGDMEYTLAFRWSEETGMESVADWLERHGVQTSDSQTLTDASAISDDGSVVAGIMDDPDGTQRAYIARVIDDGPNPNPGTGIMDVAEYQASLYGAASVANSGEFLTWLPMNGAHHRPLMLTPNLSGDMCAWATGDFAHHGDSSTNLALAEAGACVDLAGGAVRLGGAVGTTRSWQNLALGGALNMAGQYVLGEVDWQPDGTPLLLSLTGMIGGWQANIDRAYSNGAATAVSSGQTNALGGVVRVRADWLEAAVIGNTSINPWASLAFGGLRVDGYSETGGPFPASFAAQHLGHADIRLGVTAITELSSQTKLSTTLEVAHRSGMAAAAVGQVDGLFNFSLGGGNYAQTWGRLGLELDHAITDAVSLSSSVHLATNGRDPTVAFSAGIKGAF